LHLVGFLSSRFTHDARSQEHKAHMYMLNDVSLGRGVFAKPNYTYVCEFRIIHTVTFLTVYSLTSKML